MINCEQQVGKTPDLTKKLTYLLIYCKKMENKIYICTTYFAQINHKQFFFL